LSDWTVDIFVNCIYLATPIPKFLTTDFIAEAGKDRRLSVVVDVSCEWVRASPECNRILAGLAVEIVDTFRSTTNPHNPIPIYPPVNTSFPEPTVEVKVGEGNPRMTVIAIDHLPTLVSTLSFFACIIVYTSWPEVCFGSI
jgi:saccharopine dehydrogenase (NAD+, L-lysine-forming)